MIDPTAAKVADNNAVNDEANTIATTSIAPQTNAVNDEADTIATTTVTAEAEHERSTPLSKHILYTAPQSQKEGSSFMSQFQIENSE